MIKLEEYIDSLDKCSYCGYCQETCPLYISELFEPYTARSRINLIRSVFLEKSWPLSAGVLKIIDSCMLCTQCTRTCSGRVPIDEIVIAARSEIHRGIEFKKMVIKNLLTRRSLIKTLVNLGYLSQKYGLAPKIMPDLPKKTFEQAYSGTYSPAGKPRARVAYFVGCGTNFMFPDTGKSVVEVLNHNNIEVIIPPGQVCCGIPLMAQGDLQSVVDMVLSNVKVFEKLEVDAIITDCTSCGMMLKEKAVRLMPKDSDLETRVTKFSGGIWEVTDYLSSVGLVAPLAPLTEKYSYHVPCHHGWEKGVKDAPTKILAQIPEAQYEEMQYPEGCCGGAGTYFINHIKISQKIRARKIQSIKNTGADTIVTQCPVCRYYLASQLQGQRVIHPVSLLAESYNVKG